MRWHVLDKCLHTYSLNVLALDSKMEPCSTNKPFRAAFVFLLFTIKYKLDTSQQVLELNTVHSQVTGCIIAQHRGLDRVRSR